MVVSRSSLCEDACVEQRGYASGFAVDAMLSAGVVGFPGMLRVDRGAAGPSCGAGLKPACVCGEGPLPNHVSRLAELLLPLRFCMAFSVRKSRCKWCHRSSVSCPEGPPAHEHSSALGKGGVKCGSARSLVSPVWLPEACSLCEESCAPGLLSKAPWSACAG